MSSDLKKLQGTWHINSLETDGQEMPPEAFRGSQIIVHENKFTSTGMGFRYEGIMEIDESKKPKAFDLVFTAGPQKDTRNLGIYTLTGDSWTICLAMQGGKRPRKFAT
ncbi:MAG TPA: TIGR03067 domain-containing protein, partial [Candidatus Angelobacter sp.]|nr:TIGR03067 domain-containing protein [Candidatus Angelobacter sp.]